MSVADRLKRPLSARSRTFDRMGMVFLRSTTLWTWPRARSSAARSMVIFMVSGIVPRGAHLARLLQTDQRADRPAGTGPCGPSPRTDRIAQFLQHTHGFPRPRRNAAPNRAMAGDERPDHSMVAPRRSGPPARH